MFLFCCEFYTELLSESGTMDAIFRLEDQVMDALSNHFLLKLC